jgi:hypothetical protein
MSAPEIPTQRPVDQTIDERAAWLRWANKHRGRALSTLEKLQAQAVRNNELDPSEAYKAYLEGFNGQTASSADVPETRTESDTIAETKAILPVFHEEFQMVTLQRLGSLADAGLLGTFMDVYGQTDIAPGDQA